MTPSDREAASAFLASPTVGPHWYSGRFQRYHRKVWNPRSDGLWKQLCAPTHGGFMGLRLFRSDPLRVDVKPRKDPQKAAMAIPGAVSALIDLLYAWDQFIGRRGPEYRAIKALMAQAETQES